MKTKQLEEITSDLEGQKIKRENLHQKYSYVLDQRPLVTTEGKDLIAKLENQIEACNNHINNLEDKKACLKNDKLRNEELWKLFESIKFELREFSNELVNQLILHIVVQGNKDIIIELKSGYKLYL